MSTVYSPIEPIRFEGPQSRQPAGLGACRAWGVEAKIGPSEDSFWRIRRPIATAMGQKADEKWTVAVNLQPTLPKPDRLSPRQRSGRQERLENLVNRFV